MTDDRRLIEDFLPIQAISAEASREKSVRKGHISTLHLWWARRPLVACRAAVYGALVPASKFVPENGPDNKKQSLGRANAAKFLKRLCRYPSDSKREEKLDIELAVKEAQRHILEAHAERLTVETGQTVTAEDIEEGRAPRPKVLDMFAGGGAIPLEALRLGCEAYALDLNPVAHIIQLCTLVYPQKYGKPDPNVRGMTGPKNAKGETTWAGLAKEVRYWGEWVLKKVKAEIGDLYPLIPDPEFNRKEKNKNSSTGGPPVQKDLFISQRNLPHWELGGSTYFITYRCVTGMTLDESSRTIVMDNWKHWHQKRYLLHAAVIMPDHVHVLITPKEKNRGVWFSLEEILHTNKGFTAHEINKSTNRSGSVWQDERFDRIMRNEEEFIEKWNYMRTNPIKAGLVENDEDYRWLFQNPEAWIEDEQNTGGPPVPPDSSLDQIPPGYLIPVAYLWTRTVRCKNPTCGATVPLVRQTWLCKKKDRYVALKMVTGSTGGSPVSKKVRFEVVESTTEKGLGFDPTAFSKGGNATCPFCGTVADSEYIKTEGRSGRVGLQAMSTVCTRSGAKGKIYLSADEVESVTLDDGAIQKRIAALCKRSGLTVPGEPMPAPGTLGFRVQPYGVRTWGDLFTRRQMLSLLALTAAVREAELEMPRLGCEANRAKAVVTMLAAIVDRLADFNSSLCVFNYTGGRGVVHTFGRHALPMVWDFAESNPFNPEAASWVSGIEDVPAGLRDADMPYAAVVERGSATSLPWESESVDAVITDPPYYDNVPYADISDFFYVWLRRTVGHLYPEHFASDVTPKKSEAVAEPTRYGGSKDRAREAYEAMMAQSFSEASRVLKPGGQLTVVYAHKTTLGWSTLVDALRRAGFIVTEAWPLDTEKPGRLRAQESAALASSIFLVARKREGSTGGSPVIHSSGQRPVPAISGSYEDEVRPALERIVRERVDSLWKMGITGADLVIAAVGAGLRAFTKFSRVEYANGEEVPAEKFLAEVEGVVLETLLEKIFGVTGSGVAAVDGSSRFYVLWRYAYKAAEMDAGEAIVFTYGQNVELDGQNGLSSGSRALVEKKKGKYRLRDFAERGDDEKLGMPKDDNKAAPLIDILHRILWLVENEPRKLNDFLDEARPDRERLRLVAQALAGTALTGRKDDGPEHTLATTPAEGAALKKLVANWRTLIETRLSDVDIKTGQRRIVYQ
jgi:putative DNA methylase